MRLGVPDDTGTTTECMSVLDLARDDLFCRRNAVGPSRCGVEHSSLATASIQDVRVAGPVERVSRGSFPSGATSERRVDGEEAGIELGRCEEVLLSRVGGEGRDGTSVLGAGAGDVGLREGSGSAPG